MAYALAKENEAFIGRMVRLGRFNNQNEVVREALRRMEREELSYLNPRPLTPEEARRIYASNPEEEEQELAMARDALRSLRKNAGRKA
jgi:Arc/MetJ-type ribon-helix-helix transcriptional regulator